MDIQVPSYLKNYVSVAVDENQKKITIYVSPAVYTSAKYKSFKNLTEMKTKSKGYTIEEVVSDVIVSNEAIRDTDVDFISIIVTMINRAAQLNVSDIHIEVRDKMEVFFRIDGKLIKQEGYVNTKETGERILASIYANATSASDPHLSENEYQSCQLTHDEKNAIILPNNVEAIRVQTGPMHRGKFMVLRLLYKQTKFEIQITGNIETDARNTFGKYGYDETTIQRIIPVLLGAEGLAIIAGPTGSGKSTSLKLMLELIHSVYPHKSKFSIEDPPEYIITGAKQIPVIHRNDGKSAFAFAEALKVAMRSDPDVILVGETRDEETAQTLVNAVLTGHQTFTTLHAINVFTIFERMKKLKMDIEDLIQSGAIKLLIAQRLVPKLCDNCKIKIETNGIVRYDNNPKGCEKCNYTGIAGRVVVEECINFQDLEQLQSYHVITDYLKANKLSMKDKAIRLIQEGKISLSDAISTIGYFDV